MADIDKVFSLNNVYKPVDFTIPSSEQAGSEPVDFAEVLRSTLQEVNSLQYQAKQAQVALATGSEDVSLHQVMVVAEQARLALDFTMAVRNKVMDAYTEIMRMQI